MVLENQVGRLRHLKAEHGKANLFECDNLGQIFSIHPNKLVQFKLFSAFSIEKEYVKSNMHLMEVLRKPKPLSVGR